MLDTTARLRDGDTAGESSALRRSVEPANTASILRNWVNATDGSTFEPGAATTSTSAFAYRVATTDNILVLRLLPLQIDHEFLHQSVFGSGIQARPNALLRQVQSQVCGVSLEFATGRFSSRLNLDLGLLLHFTDGCRGFLADAGAFLFHLLAGLR